MTRAGLRVEPLRRFARGNVVVVEQRASWGRDTNESQLVATAFAVDYGRVVRVARFDTLAVALEAAGLAESDEVKIEP